MVGQTISCCYDCFFLKSLFFGSDLGGIRARGIFIGQTCGQGEQEETAKEYFE